MPLPGTIRTITLIGAGNVAWHLGRALKQKGYTIREVCSHTLSSASELAGKLGCSYTTSPEALDPGSDLYIIAVNDAAIPAVLSQLRLNDPLLVHTAGSVDISVLSGYSRHTGVFYPLQTFSKHIPVNMSEVPFCIEATDDESRELLIKLAADLSEFVRIVSSEQRLLLHVAAVFASNYSNLMYTLASDLLSSRGLTFDFLKPLVAETARKAITGEPSRVQTGPAKRGDQEIINKHLRMLASKPEFAEIYLLLADRIRERYKE